MKLFIKTIIVLNLVFFMFPGKSFGLAVGTFLKKTDYFQKLYNKHAKKRGYRLFETILNSRVSIDSEEEEFKTLIEIKSDYDRDYFDVLCVNLKELDFLDDEDCLTDNFVNLKIDEFFEKFKTKSLIEILEIKENKKKKDFCEELYKLLVKSLSLKEQYRLHPKSYGGRVIGTGIVREIYAGVGIKGVSKSLLPYEMLKDLMGKEGDSGKTVYMLVGGPGSGKGTYLNKNLDNIKNKEDFLCIYDSRFGSYDKAMAILNLIKQKAGLKINLRWVFRRIGRSYMGGVIPRAITSKTKDIYSILPFISNHVKIQKILQKLMQKERDNKNITFRIRFSGTTFDDKGVIVNKEIRSLKKPKEFFKWLEKNSENGNLYSEENGLDYEYKDEMIRKMILALIHAYKFGYQIGENVEYLSKMQVLKAFQGTQEEIDEIKKYLSELADPEKDSLFIDIFSKFRKKEYGEYSWEKFFDEGLSRKLRSKEIPVKIIIKYRETITEILASKFKVLEDKEFSIVPELEPVTEKDGFEEDSIVGTSA
jgi:hypothetical protein